MARCGDPSDANSAPLGGAIDVSTLMEHLNKYRAMIAQTQLDCSPSPFLSLSLSLAFGSRTNIYVNNDNNNSHAFLLPNLDFERTLRARCALSG